MAKRYRHYKGNTYTVLHEAEDAGSDARGRVIVYRGEDGRLWTRPALEFYGTVALDGAEVPRFSLLPSTTPTQPTPDMSGGSDPLGED